MNLLFIRLFFLIERYSLLIQKMPIVPRLGEQHLSLGSGKRGCTPIFPWGMVAQHPESPPLKVLIAFHYHPFSLTHLSFRFLVSKMGITTSSNFQECYDNYMRLIM